MAGTYEIMTGNEACTRAAIAAGMRFFAGYPITPATEIAEMASELLPKAGGTYMQMEDELASIAAVIGASAAGVKAMTATSGPGVSLMQENLGYAIMAEIPLVLVDCMRQGPCQGVATVPARAILCRPAGVRTEIIPSLRLPRLPLVNYMKKRYGPLIWQKRTGILSISSATPCWPI